jgi:hypothetical protein
MTDDDLAGVARGSETLLDVLATLTRDGFTGQFMAAAPEEDAAQAGRVECLSCHSTSAAASFEVSELRRLEGASDPDDMLAIVALTCPNCSARGALTLNYGPTATIEDSAALLSFNA